MADASEKNTSSSTKITGANASGTESNYVEATAAGGLHTNLRSADGTELGTNSNPIQAIPATRLSTLNSTSTPLAGGAAFTGTWENVLGVSTITLSVFTSHASAASGLQFQTSSDGVNWDNGDEFTISAMAPGGAKVFSFGVTAQYFRVVYTNGPTLQTAFRLQTILHYAATKSSSHRVDAAIVDEDDAELTKSVITGKAYISGEYKNVLTDEFGRLLVSDLSPVPSISVVERRVLASEGVYAFTRTITQDTAIKEMTFGGRGAGEGMFGKYVAATEEFVPNGNFESPAEVSQWISTGLGDGLALVPTYSTAQAFTGTGSLSLGPATRSDANHYPQVTYTWPTPQSMDSWRYVRAKFYNFAPTGGAVTRTISIRLTDVNGVVRVYSVSGLTNAAPFNANGWIEILGEIRIPTSQVGTSFDINNVASISLRMQDSGNKSYTAIYWDSVMLVGAVDVYQKIYTNGNTIQLNFDPVHLFSAGEVMYLALRNNDTTSKEFQITVAGVDIT